MPKYSTKQRKILLDFFKNNTDVVFSAKEVSENLKKFQISQSSVYRNISELEKDGKLVRCTKPNSREVFYRFVNTEKCGECLHLSCKKCGKTFHMHLKSSDLMKNCLRDDENFQIDVAETVIYGVCKGCRK